MLTTLPPSPQHGLGFSALVLLIGLISGSLIGHAATPALAESISQYSDPTLLTLITLLFFSLRFNLVINSRHKLKVLVIAVIANFVLVPVIGYGIASVFLSDYPLLMVGLVIYFMSPCTDWFLGFTRLCHGDTLLGAALLPVNMVLQLLLYPVFLYVFTSDVVTIEPGILANTLQHWFIEPLALALAARVLLNLLLTKEQMRALQAAISQLIPILISLLIMQIFAGNIHVLLSHINVVAWLLLAVFCFFVLTFVLSELLSKRFALPYAEHVLLTMTIAARNAPLMLAVTMVALPSQPLIYAAIVIGMLLEFPHLTLLSHLLMRSSQTKTKKLLHD
ncbi:arsenic resistance protein [uncultured Methylophaga sp.]|uniref:arsenic resistance protein n=1 Tax=uncultured Methylophaga sp. TaxID=285271 RepID=UPI0026188675|nr:arsenic resistance protein [uncultured Methylophaga sp.]